MTTCMNKYYLNEVEPSNGESDRSKLACFQLVNTELLSNCSLVSPPVGDPAIDYNAIF